jgi:hypothetical protein
MYPSTPRHQSSFEGVQNPSTSAVVGTVLAAAVVPLAAVALLSHPGVTLATVASITVRYRFLTLGRTGGPSRPFRRSLAGIIGRGARADSVCCEDAA